MDLLLFALSQRDQSTTMLAHTCRCYVMRTTFDSVSQCNRDVLAFEEISSTTAQHSGSHRRTIGARSRKVLERSISPAVAPSGNKGSIRDNTRLANVRDAGLNVPPATQGVDTLEILQHLGPSKPPRQRQLWQ